MAEAFPLFWPEGWPRATSRKRASFKVLPDKVRKDLFTALRGMGATNVVFSSNVPLRQDGTPSADMLRKTTTDPGVAVYFTYRGKQMVMARDAFTTPADNMRSLYWAIDGLRQIARHGGGAMMERAFAGFAALPAPDARKPWREVLGMTSKMVPVTRTHVEAAFREKAKERHPDRGGSDTLMAELNAAREAALSEIGR